jgi:hypothetical protein
LELDSSRLNFEVQDVRTADFSQEFRRSDFALVQLDAETERRPVVAIDMPRCDRIWDERHYNQAESYFAASG